MLGGFYTKLPREIAKEREGEREREGKRGEEATKS
jgi:hypothetical protein